jgi:ABC-type transporter Mla subunit MlaD
MIKKIFFSAIAALVLIGCIGTTYNFKIRFNDIQGLRKNDRVFFDKTAIGEITGIEYADIGNYLVSVAVEVYPPRK